MSTLSLVKLVTLHAMQNIDLVGLLAGAVFHLVQHPI